MSGDWFASLPTGTRRRCAQRSLPTQVPSRPAPRGTNNARLVGVGAAVGEQHRGHRVGEEDAVDGKAGAVADDDGRLLDLGGERERVEHDLTFCCVGFGLGRFGGFGWLGWSALRPWPRAANRRRARAAHAPRPPNAAHLLARRLGAHDLEQRHHVRRREEVRADDTRLGGGRELGADEVDVDRRRVGREDAVGAAGLLQVGKDALLEADVL